MRIRDCPWSWGSHGCHLPYLHEGNHQCIDDDGAICHEVAQDGDDGTGFKWALYGGEDVDYVHPSWSPSQEPCPNCNYSTTLTTAAGSDSPVASYRCCPRCDWSATRSKESTR